MVCISFASVSSLTTVLAKSGHAALPQHLATVIQFQTKPLPGSILGGKFLNLFLGACLQILLARGSGGMPPEKGLSSLGHVSETVF